VHQSPLVIAAGNNMPNSLLCCLLSFITPHAQVLTEWGRYDRAPATQRLQLLLNEISSTPQYTMRVQQLAGANNMTATGQPCSNRAASNPSTSTSGTAALLGKGVLLGTPRMPASDRITTEVLRHTPRDDEADEEP
jgi:hypothetical protein